MFALAFAATVARAQDPLPSWNDGPAKKAIVSFVEKVAKQGGAEYVTPAERIAVFDNDGTLWSEQPMYFQLLFAIDRIKALAPGKHRIVVDTSIAKPGAPVEVILEVDGKEVARTTVKRTVPAAFTASETFDVGIDLGSPVSMEYFERRPFQFNGKITVVNVDLK